jgi:hypothetical protein
VCLDDTVRNDVILIAVTYSAAEHKPAKRPRAHASAKPAKTDRLRQRTSVANIDNNITSWPSSSYAGRSAAAVLRWRGCCTGSSAPPSPTADLSHSTAGISPSHLSKRSISTAGGAPRVAGVVELGVEGFEAVVREVGDDRRVAPAVAGVVVVREQCRLHRSWGLSGAGAGLAPRVLF